MTIEPNNAAWSAGDTVENSHHYSAQFHTFKSTYTVWNPMVQNNESIAIGLTGLGASNGMPAINVANTTPNNLFVGHGGTATPPAGMNFVGTNGNGIFNSIASMQYAPEPSGASLISAGCPASGCNWNRFFYYNLINAGGNNYGGQISFNPYWGEMTIGNGTAPVQWAGGSMNYLNMVDNLHFSPMATPTATLSTGTGYGTLLDNTTYYYKVAARNNAGYSLSSTEVSITTGNSGSNSNYINVAISRVQGATIYQICGRATSGGELQISTTSGVDNTLYVDTGSATPSGSCNNTATQPGVDQAGYVGINSPGTIYEQKVVAPSGLTSYPTVTIPCTANCTLATTANTIGYVATGTTALSTAAVASGTCQGVTAGTVNSSAATGAATTNVLTWSPAVSLQTVTGYQVSTSGALSLDGYITAGYVNFNVCNWTGSSITPGALTLNWRVLP
jgi:hypothetical protein